MSVCLIDTSVFCELLSVPNMNRRHEEMVGQLSEKLKAQETLLLPMTTILETGNHIGQSGDGRQRREAAKRFVSQVRLALQGQSPFTPTPLFRREDLGDWLDEFPDWAMRSDSRGKGRGAGWETSPSSRPSSDSACSHRFVGSISGHSMRSSPGTSASHLGRLGVI